MPGLDSNTLACIHFDGDFIDVTGRHTVTTSGASIDTSVKKFGSGSGKVINNYSGIMLGGNLSDFVFSGDYTIDVWLEAVSSPDRCFILGGYTPGALSLYAWNPGYLGWLKYGAWSAASEQMISADALVHVAVERYEGTLYLYYNGVNILTRVDSDSHQWHDGTYFHAATAPETSPTIYFDELRISDISRYHGTNFTPAAEAYSQDPLFLATRRLSRERAFSPILIGGHAINTNRTFYHAPKTYAITISSNTDNVNLRDEANSSGYSGEDEAIITCTIDEGVMVGSTSDSTPALDVGTWPEGFLIPITITNRGSIVGYNPNGTALETTTNIYVDNYGTIRATGTGYALNGVALMAWGNVGLIEGETDEDFFGYHTKPWLLRRLSRELFPIEILRGHSFRRRATHMHDLYLRTRKFIQSYRVADDSLDRYELYLNGSSTPDATSPTLPFTKEVDIPVSGSEEISILVKKRNRFNLASFNQLATVLEIDSYGDEDLGPIATPEILELRVSGVGGLLVRASYDMDSDRNPADTWKIFAKEGSAPDPETDIPKKTGTIKRGTAGTAQFAGIVSGMTPGSDVYTIVEVLRTADGTKADSSSDHLETLESPTMSGISASIFGGSTIEIQ